MLKVSLDVLIEVLLLELDLFNPSGVEHAEIRDCSQKIPQCNKNAFGGVLVVVAEGGVGEGVGRGNTSYPERVVFCADFLVNSPHNIFFQT